MPNLYAVYYWQFIQVSKQILVKNYMSQKYEAEVPCLNNLNVLTYCYIKRLFSAIIVLSTFDLEIQLIWPSRSLQ